MLSSLPKTGYVFWPVGTGDSTTLCVDEDTVLQVDINHLSAAEQDDDDRTPVIDSLEELLPKRNSRPYLAVFVLTHPDLDHCRGFKELRERIDIGELWFAPRIFFENKSDLCNDAIDFRDEARRRVKATIDAGGGDVESGDRVQIIGYADLLEEDDYAGFPDDSLYSPGDTITHIDGDDRADAFAAFIHAPFKDDQVASARNETSVGLRVELIAGDGGIGRTFLLGDLSYPTVRRVFDESRDHDNEDKLEWDVFLSPHHCSKSVMYWKDEGDDEETLRQDILDDIETAADGNGYIIASSAPIPAKNKEGDNPPHAKAKARYEEIVPDEFLCTGEHPNESDLEPIVFEVTGQGLTYVAPGEETEPEDQDDATELASAISAAQAGAEPPTERVGFGDSV